MFNKFFDYSDLVNRPVRRSVKHWYNKFRIHYSGNQKHSFHIVTRSPWPLYASIAALMLTFGLVMRLHNYIYGSCV